MNFLKNIDSKIEEYISEMISKEDHSKINFILSDFENFFQHGNEFFISSRNIKEKDNLEYEINILDQNNSYKNILTEKKIFNTIKIFYRIGLKDHIFDRKGMGKQRIFFRFILNEKISKKMYSIHIFLDNLLKYLNSNN